MCVAAPVLLSPDAHVALLPPLLHPALRPAGQASSSVPLHGTPGGGAALLPHMSHARMPAHLTSASSQPCPLRPAGQAFSLVLYTLVGLASTALVLSIAVPQVRVG